MESFLTRVTNMMTANDQEPAPAPYPPGRFTNHQEDRWGLANGIPWEPKRAPTWGLRWKKLISVAKIVDNIAVNNNLLCNLEWFAVRKIQKLQLALSQAAGTEYRPVDQTVMFNGTQAISLVGVVYSKGNQLKRSDPKDPTTGVSKPFAKRVEDCDHPEENQMKRGGRGQKHWTTCTVCGGRWDTLFNGLQYSEFLESRREKPPMKINSASCLRLIVPGIPPVTVLPDQPSRATPVTSALHLEKTPHSAKRESLSIKRECPTQMAVPMEVSMVSGTTTPVGSDETPQLAQVSSQPTSFFGVKIAGDWPTQMQQLMEIHDHVRTTKRCSSEMAIKDMKDCAFTEPELALVANFEHYLESHTRHMMQTFGDTNHFSKAK